MCEEGKSTYFSRQLKAVRQRQGLSINDLSGKTGINPKTLYRYESGSSLPRDFGTWVLLAKGHGMDLAAYMDALFGKKNIQPLDDLDFKKLEERIAGLERRLKKCPLVDSS